MKVYKKDVILKDKTYTNVFIEFDNGFTIQVKPCFELSKKQYIAYRKNIDQLPYKEVVKKEE